MRSGLISEEWTWGKVDACGNERLDGRVTDMSKTKGRTERQLSQIRDGWVKNGWSSEQRKKTVQMRVKGWIHEENTDVSRDGCTHG